MKTSKRKKILIDENLSFRLIDQLADIFPSITHASLEGLTSELDINIWQFARNHFYTILTKDADFKKFSNSLGCPPKVIKINCGNKTTKYITQLLEVRKEVIYDFWDDDDDCYLEII